MILFSLKACNIVPLVHCARAVLTERKVDPFLHLIEDNKLQAVSFAPDNLTTYGSKEDDDRAIETLSELLTFNQDQEFFVSEIVRSLANLSELKLLLVISNSILF
ncbi:hypothetical protein E2542_SST24869 [Spatholobus suberectus]|nr:hypothetical protein E2542_SST24869 [Spatholobus suberectus]